jgi:hypothetical protein
MGIPIPYSLFPITKMETKNQYTCGLKIDGTTVTLTVVATSEELAELIHEQFHSSLILVSLILTPCPEIENIQSPL